MNCVIIKINLLFVINVFKKFSIDEIFFILRDKLNKFFSIFLISKLEALGIQIKTKSIFSFSLLRVFGGKTLIPSIVLPILFLSSSIKYSI